MSQVRAIVGFLIFTSTACTEAPSKSNDLNLDFEERFKSACIAAIHDEILSPATMTVATWTYAVETVRPDVVEELRARTSAERAEDFGDEARRLLNRDLILKYDIAVADGIEPKVHQGEISFDSHNRLAVPIRSDAQCIHKDFGPSEEIYIELDIFERNTPG